MSILRWFRGRFDHQLVRRGDWDALVTVYGNKLLEDCPSMQNYMIGLLGVKNIEVTDVKMLSIKEVPSLNRDALVARRRFLVRFHPTEISVAHL